MTIDFKYRGVYLELDIYHQPYEKQTLEHDGCEDGIQIEGIFIKGVDVYELLCDQLEQIKEEYLSSMR